MILPSNSVILTARRAQLTQLDVEVSGAMNLGWLGNRNRKEGTPTLRNLPT